MINDLRVTSSRGGLSDAHTDEQSPCLQNGHALYISLLGQLSHRCERLHHIFLPAIDAILDERLWLFCTDEHLFCNMIIVCGGCGGCCVSYIYIYMVLDASRQFFVIRLSVVLFKGFCMKSSYVIHVLWRIHAVSQFASLTWPIMTPILHPALRSLPTTPG